MTATISSVLRDAAKLIAKGWTRGLFARDAKGDSIPTSHDGACCWCASGAIRRTVFLGTGERPDHSDVEHCLGTWLRRNQRTDKWVVFWNDHVAKDAAEVIAAMNAAADEAEAKEKP